MKRLLLISLLISLSMAGFSQDIKQTQEFALMGVRSSDDFEYEQFSYNEDLLLQATNNLTVDGIKFKDTLSYDGFNNISKLDTYQFIGSDWVYVSYIEYTHDESGNRLTRSNYNSLGTPIFTLGGIYHYFYDEDNKLINWELYMGGTDLMQICTLVYNDDNKVIEEIGQDAFMSGVMENSYKIHYQYDNEGMLTSKGQSFWNGSSWDLYTTEWFFYDENNNCIKWEYRTGSLVRDKKEYEYNLDISVDQIIRPVYPEFQAKDLVHMNNMVTVQHWYTENDIGNLVYVCDYIYDYDPISPLGMANHMVDPLSLNIFPNPTSDILTIIGNNTIINQIDLLDNAGKIVLENSHLNKKELNLDLSPLKSGIYFLRLKTSRGVFTEKLIVQ